MVPTFLLPVLNAVLSGALAVATATSPPQAASPGVGPATHRVVGADVSWPNCPKGLGMPQRRTKGMPMPGAAARFVVIGLTNGPAFHPNPCLVSQVAFAQERHLWAAAYAVATYPTRSQRLTYGRSGPRSAETRTGRLWNTGHAQARVNLANMRAAGLDSPVVWVDVEPVSPPSPWSKDRRANAAVVEGAIRAYRDAGLRVGVYSVPRLWRQIVGPVRYGLPEWRTAGDTSLSAALRECRTDPIQGGPAVLAQWWGPKRDFDVVCPGRPAQTVLDEYFVKF